MTKKMRWTDYDRAVLIAHHRQFGVTNLDKLCEKIPHRTRSSIKVELFRFNNWILYDVMELHYRRRPSNDVNLRIKTRNVYTKIISDLNL
jgi:hypothetical protein